MCRVLPHLGAFAVCPCLQWPFFLQWTHAHPAGQGVFADSQAATSLLFSPSLLPLCTSNPFPVGPILAWAGHVAGSPVDWELWEGTALGSFISVFTMTPTAVTGTPWSGGHLSALCHGLLSPQCMKLPLLLPRGSWEEWLSGSVARALGKASWGLDFPFWAFSLLAPGLSSLSGPKALLLRRGLRAQCSECVGIRCCLLCLFQILPPLSVCLSVCLSPLILPLRCVINQEFTVKGQEKPNDVFSSGKYPVPQVASGCLRNRSLPELRLLRPFSVDLVTLLKPLMWLW